MGQGDNFGIGIPAPANTGNIVEDNEIVGNVNGLFLAAGVQGNTFRRNTILGNPPIQIAVDHTANTSSGFDIKNLATAGANTFEANACLTSINAPCPAASLTATPNPVLVQGAADLGTTTISWTARGVDAVEIRVGGPDGELFTRGGSRGSAQTGLWVRDGMTFYLQDAGNARALTAENTLATVVVRLQRR